MTRAVEPRSIVALVVVLLVAAACQSQRSAPEMSVAPASAPRSAVLTPNQVDRPVTIASGSAMPRYPESLRNSGVQGEARVSVVIDESGMADMSTFRLVSATHELFAEAVRSALPTMRFNPALRGGVAVRQVVDEPFTFSVR